MFWLVAYVSCVGTFSFIVSLKKWEGEQSWVPWHCRFLTSWWIGLVIVPLMILSLPWLAYSIAEDLEKELERDEPPRFRFPKKLIERRDYN